MYEQVFQFSARPFTATPFVKHYFAGTAIQQSLGQAKLCIDRAAGPVIVIGDIGSGKSLLLAMLEQHYAAELVVVNLGCARLETRNDLLQSILFELGESVQGRSEAELRFALMEKAKPGPDCPDGLLLLVDDAETLSRDLIEELRLITNYIVDGQPRVRLVMAGRNGLEERLADPKLASFNQRVATRCYLANLDQAETARYVVEHIDRAGGTGSTVFASEALQQIAKVTDGCPRLINQVCEIALILGATRGELKITPELISEAWSDLDGLHGSIAVPDAPKVVGREDWTVIEFGQLEEEGETSPSAHSRTSSPKATAGDFPEATLSEAAVDPEAAARADMAAQLAAVFGSGEFGAVEMESATESASADDVEHQAMEEAASIKSIAELEIEQQALLDQVLGDSASAHADDLEQRPVALTDDGSATEEAEVECESSSPATAAANTTIDPFAEDFDEEEPLRDRFLPAFAQYNASSLQLTAAELEYVRPWSFDTDRETSLPVLSSESILPDEHSLDDDCWKLDSVETEDQDHVNALDSARVDKQASQLDSDGLAHEEDCAGESEASVEVESTDWVDNSIDGESVVDHPETQYHQHVMEASTDDITRQAEAILARLSASKHVSHETADQPSQESFDSPEDESEDRQAEQRIVERVDSVGVDDPSEQILDEIRDQQRILNVSAVEASLAVPKHHSFSPEPQAQRPSRPQDGPQDPGMSEAEPVHRDDSEMIIVNQMKQPEAVDHSAQDPIPFPETPVSTGRAERMDYKSLFDQLRNLKNRGEH